jgi:tyrosine-protein kinase Etk/Wzc
MTQPLPSSTHAVGLAEPTVIGAALRHRMLVAVTTLVFGLGALALTVARPPEFLAVATVLLEDPNTTDVLQLGRATSSERLVANQLEVFRSSIVTRRAAELAREGGAQVSFGDVLRGTQVSSLRNTDVITLSYSSEDEQEAELVVASLLAAYAEVRVEQRRAESESILARLDAAEDVLGRELEQVRAALSALRVRRAFDTQIEGVLDQLAEVGRALAIVTDPDERTALLDQERELEGHLGTLRAASDAEAERPEADALLRSEEQLLSRLGALAATQSDVEIQAESVGTGIAFQSPPAVAEAGAGAGRLFTLVAGLFLGAMVGLGIAYALSARRRVFSDRIEPEVVLGLPFLADVPVFDDTSKETMLPVRDNPRSTAAEAFRFVASALDVRLEQASARSMMFVSATVGDGKSTVVANTAMALARSGKRVLVVDADFGNQALSRLLLGDIRLGAGLTEVVAGKVRLVDATQSVEISRGIALDLLGRGLEPVAAVDFFGERETSSTIRRLADLYDLVIVDGPPLLQVAYASTIARLADTVAMVVRHGAPFRTAQELAQRLGFIQSNVLGYVYNQAPPRTGMVESGGSMKDVMGDQGLVAEVPKRRS